MKIYIVIDVPEVTDRETAYKENGVVEKIIDQVEKIEQISNHDWWVEIE